MNNCPCCKSHNVEEEVGFPGVLWCKACNTTWDVGDETNAVTIKALKTPLPELNELPELPPDDNAPDDNDDAPGDASNGFYGYDTAGALAVVAEAE